MLLVVGGHSRKIGKTSVVAGLIAGTREARWTAVKISANRSQGHLEGGHILIEESAVAPQNDSARYLQAGAERAYWLRASKTQLAGAMPDLCTILTGAQNAILESNRVLRYLDPDLYVVVLDFAVDDFKESTREFLDRADAFVVVDRSVEAPWPEVAEVLRWKPVFRVPEGVFTSMELTAFLRERLG
jgi:hypothetical protein